MIAIFGSGIIGLFTAHKLLMQGKKVRIFENKNKEGNSTDASVGMLAPLVEAKPYEKELLPGTKCKVLLFKELNRNQI